MAIPNPNLIYRTAQSSSLTYAQLDGNFAYLSQSIADITSVESASYAANADNALTASYINATNIDGTVTSALNADNALTASYIDAANVDGTVTSASYALSASYAPASNPFPFTGDAEFSGSILVSGSIIPNVDGSATSSFDLGSPTAAWKDIYVSNGTINFLDAGGNIVQTMGTGNNSLEGDTTVNGNLYLNSTLPTNGAFIHGNDNIATGESSHAQGYYSIASGSWSHAEGGGGLFEGGRANGVGSHAEGAESVASGLYSHAEGFKSQAPGYASHAEGRETIASGQYSHAEGQSTWATNLYAHAEGAFTTASANHSHAEGYYTLASGSWSHAEGMSTIARGEGSHAEGDNTIAQGDKSHAEGLGTIAVANHQHVSGKYNVTSSDANDLFIIGNGTSNVNRKNILTVSTSNVTVSGSILVSGSLIPNTNGASSTSSFSLGSPTNAWKDIYVSDGTINFVNSAGQIQGTLGAGTNKTVITGSLTVLPKDTLALTDFSQVVRLHKQQLVGYSLSLWNPFTQTGNPGLYNTGYATPFVLPWDRKVSSYYLNNKIPTGSISDGVEPWVILPPPFNSGHGPGDIISIYNMSNSTSSLYKSSGSISVFSGWQGITNVDSSSMLVTGTFNTGTLLSGSWGNYKNVNANYALSDPTLYDAVKIAPGQKATFELIVFSSATSQTITRPSNTDLTNNFPGDGYDFNQTDVNSTTVALYYLFKGIENL